MKQELFAMIPVTIRLMKLNLGSREAQTLRETAVAFLHP